MNWSSAAPMSAEDELDLAEAKRSIGMPLESVLREMGYEPAQIMEILAMAKRASDRAIGIFDRQAGLPGEDEGGT